MCTLIKIMNDKISSSQVLQTLVIFLNFYVVLLNCTLSGFFVSRMQIICHVIKGELQALSSYFTERLFLKIYMRLLQ